MLCKLYISKNCSFIYNILQYYMINAIFAIDLQGGMGVDGNLPWPPDKEDFAWFKQHTVNQIVVMGSKTWNSTMPTPLPNRINVVVSSKSIECFPGANAVISASNLELEFKNLAENWPNASIWVIGGPSLLQLAKPLIVNAYITYFCDIWQADTILDINSWLTGFDLNSEQFARNKIFRTYVQCKNI